MSDKKFTFTVLSIFSVLTIFVVAFNYWIDPLWHYDRAHAYNKVQKVVDEREQKTAQIEFQRPQYDTLLVGSSRATYIQPSAFQKWDVFNFSVANLSMREYHTFILYAKKQNEAIKRVILGVDFFKSSEQEASTPRSHDNYEKKINEPLYRTKSLVSLPTFRYAFGNFMLSKKDAITEDRLYNRAGDAFAKKLTEAETDGEMAYKIERFEETFYGEHYEYFSQYKEIMAKVRDEIADEEVFVFTTPISMELFHSLVETGLYDDFEVWLRDLVEVYGGIWNFMYPNDVTKNKYNYYDGHHFYPEVGDLIAEVLEEGQLKDSEMDFGVFVTGDNIDQHLDETRKWVEENF